MGIFSFRGRVDRSTNLFIQFTLNVTGWSLGGISARIIIEYRFASIFLLLAICVGTWIGAASYVKRAHDVGRSASFALTPYLVVMIALPLGLEIEPQASSLGIIIIVTALIYFFGVLLWLIFKAGDAATNRYGEAPPPPPSSRQLSAPVEQSSSDA